MPSMAETSLHQELEKLDTRWNELSILVAVANGYEQESSEYSSLCRAISILMCSHLEGSLKAISKAITRDINDNVGFSGAPKSLQHAFVEKVLLCGAEGVNKNGVKRIIDKLGDTNIQIDENRLFDSNQNPKISVLEKHGSYLGVTNVLSFFARSDLEKAFEDDKSVSDKLLQEVKCICSAGSREFPYGFDSSRLRLIDKGQGARRDFSESFFGSFLENLLKKRHDIVHGSELANTVSLVTIKEEIIKVQLLVYGYTIIVGDCLENG